MRIKAGLQKLPDDFQMDWQPITTAPFDRDLELAFIDAAGIHTLVFPCRRLLHSWVSSEILA
jgi:hypothetical protein